LIFQQKIEMEVDMNPDLMSSRIHLLWQRES